MIGTPRRTLASLLIALLALALAGCEESAPQAGGPQRFGGYTMGTTYSVQIAMGIDAAELATLERGVSELLTRLDKDIFSTYEPRSELSQLNAAPVGEPVVVSVELFEVLRASEQIFLESGGAFDPTVGPLVELWGFGPGGDGRASRVPSSEEVEQTVTRVNFSEVALDASTRRVTRRSEVSIDLSAIAKGYGVDAVADLLVASGVENYFVEVGGELRIAGHKDETRRGWVPAIESPVEGDSRIHEIFFSRGESLAVAGSGDYRNYFEAEGRRYSHEIDPRTGRPIEHQLAAVYVVDETAMRADALATAYMIMGERSALAAASSASQAAYFIVRSGSDEQGKVVFESLRTEAFARLLEDDR